VDSREGGGGRFFIDAHLDLCNSNTEHSHKTAQLFTPSRRPFSSFRLFSILSALFRFLAIFTD
jgi:hypothetical protein